MVTPILGDAPPLENPILDVMPQNLIQRRGRLLLRIGGHALPVYGNSQDNEHAEGNSDDRQGGKWTPRIHGRLLIVVVLPILGCSSDPGKVPKAYARVREKYAGLNVLQDARHSRQ
jgi:hypothetical protein